MMERKSLPSVSIGLPVYNGEHHLRRSLESLLAQDYQDFELVISDNGSTDSTQEICAGFAAKDGRIKYHRNETNIGAGANFNKVFELSTGEYFMWVADHDLREPCFISKCVAILKADSEVVLCYPRAAWIDMDDNIIEQIPEALDTRGLGRNERFHVSLWSQKTCYIVYGMFRASALRSTKLNRHVVGPDVVLLNEMALLGTFACVPDTLFYMRRTKGANDFNVYLSKLGLRTKSRIRPYLLFGSFIRSHLLSINTHVRTYAGRGVLMASTIFCLLLRYRWLLNGLVNASRENRKQPRRVS